MRNLETFREYVDTVGDPVAAAVLTLADVLDERKGTNKLPEMATVQEAAEFLNVTPQAVYALCREKKLRSSKLGRSIRIKRTDLEKAIR